MDLGSIVVWNFLLELLKILFCVTFTDNLDILTRQREKLVCRSFAWASCGNTASCTLGCTSHASHGRHTAESAICLPVFLSERNKVTVLAFFLEFFCSAHPRVV